MSYQEFLKQAYGWHKNELWFMYFLCLVAAFLNTFFISDSVMIVLVGYGVFLKIIIASKVFCIFPSSQKSTESYSWKYLQSLPIPRKTLIGYAIGSDIILRSPFLVWYLTSLPLLKDSFKLESSYAILVLFGLISYLLITIYMTLISLHGVIQFPRQYFIKKNQKIFFYQNIRNIFIGATVLLYAVLAYAVIKEVFDFSFLKPAIKFIIDWFFPLVFLVGALVNLSFLRSLNRTWHFEQKSYPRINWSNKRDFSLIALSLGLIVLPFSIPQRDPVPHLHRGHALLEAVHRSDFIAVDRLLSEGAPINVKNKYRFSPLLVAAHNGNLKMFQFLEKKGANHVGAINVPQDVYLTGMNAFYLAIEGRNLALVEYLSKTTDINDYDKVYGYSPLHLAAVKCEDKVVDFLLKKGAVVNARNRNGNTPLHNAALRNCFGVTISLIEAGADPLLKNKDGKIAMDLMRAEKKEKELAYYLEKKTRVPASLNK